MDRRRFLVNSSSSLAAFSAPAIVHAVIPGNSGIANTAVSQFSEADWTTIASVQNHLLPSEPDAPGAVEINALTYLHDYLSNPVTDANDVRFILSGSHLLQTFTRQNINSTAVFSELHSDQRETLLRQFEQQPEGRRWLVNILNYLLESLLTDPVYGGNPDGIGWQWLEHRAGEPRPPANKRYWML